MSGALGPGRSPSYPGSRHVTSHLLVVDPVADGHSLTADMAGRGVEATVTDSTIDGLVEFGRRSPTTVIVSPAAGGIPPAQFVETIRRFASPYVIAVLDRHGTPDIVELMLAGSSAVIEGPYDASAVWELFQGSRNALHDPARVTFGSLELDARSFTVTVGGVRLQGLPLKEFELLRTLMYRAPDVVSNDELRRSAWGADGRQIPDNTLAVHVARLRNRVRGTASIRRIRGRGYGLTLD